MEIGKQIKGLRQKNRLSQEELSERIFVSRQTVSNWENDKSYPDINSLVLISEVFKISLDTLVKGDITIMKDTINKKEIKKLKKYSTVYSILLIAVIISAVPLVYLFNLWGVIPWGMLFSVAMYYAIKIEKIKKENDVQTYKEIVAFFDGKTLDEIHKQREIGKRPYQKTLAFITSALVGAGISAVIIFFIEIF